MGGKKCALDYTGEDWADLFKRDRKEFEARRREAIEALISGASAAELPHLRATQWKIDKALRGSKTPLGRMQIMQEIFYSRVYGPGGLLEQLHSSCTEYLAACERPDGRGVENGKTERTLVVVKPED